MDHSKHLALADAAVCRAERLAGDAERAAYSNDPHIRPQAQALAAAGALWSDVARTHAAIAAVLPADTQDAEEDARA